MLATLIVLLRSLRLICSGHRAVVLENLALRLQLAVLQRTARRPHLRRGRSPVLGAARQGVTGTQPWSSCSLTRSCAGTGSGSVAVGPDSPRQHVRADRVPLPPIGHSSTRWPRRILSGELLEFTGNCASRASSCRSGRCHDSCGDVVAHRHRPGERSSRITWQRSCRWTSSRCRLSMAACYSCSSPLPPPSPDRALRDHRAPHGPVDRAADHRSLSGRQRAEMALEGSRRRLR
jgi:hypothetical protein